MTKELFFQAILKFIAGVILIGLLIFLPAGTIHFWNGWRGSGAFLFSFLKHEALVRLSVV